MCHQWPPSSRSALHCTFCCRSYVPRAPGKENRALQPGFFLLTGQSLLRAVFPGLSLVIHMAQQFTDAQGFLLNQRPVTSFPEVCFHFRTTDNSLAVLHLKVASFVRVRSYCRRALFVSLFYQTTGPRCKTRLTLSSSRTVDSFGVTSPASSGASVWRSNSGCAAVTWSRS